MNELQIFQNTEFGELRILEQNGKPYFPATACAKILGYKRPADAISAHCKGSAKYRVLTNGGEQELKFISEGDLYRLIAHSKLPSAERFEAWVFDEVLPAIRQTGGYGNQTAALSQLVEQLTQVTASLAQVATLMVNASEGQAIAAEEPLRWRRPQSIIGRLDVNICQGVEEMICSGQHTYSDIVEHLADYYGETVVGTHNVMKQPANNTDKSDLFVVGKGTSSARANAFRVDASGVYGTAAFNTTGADYAELFEWKDGNPGKEDRAGRFVTLDGEKVRLATSEDDFILGIISGNPSVVGDVHDDQWQGMFMYDIFGRPIWEEVEIGAETVEEPDPANPESVITRIIVPAHTERRQKLNPDYDSGQKYIPRSERPEWGCVGMMGKLVVIDDGTCEVNGWCKPSEGGVATSSEERTDFRIMARIDETHVRVLALGRR